jgi:hypothetical protein
LNRELSFHVVALDKLSRQEKASQHALRALADEKQVLEQKLNPARKTFAEWDTSSSKVMASAVAQVVGLLTSHAANLNQ